MAVKIFISHAHDEKPLALAWANLIKRTSGVVDVWLSSDSNPNGGMALGAAWRTTIYDQMKDATLVLAILTPASVQRTWILWECGIATGVALDRGLVPVLFSMPLSDFSGPMSTYQAYSGEDIEKVTEVCLRIAALAGQAPDPKFWGLILDAYKADIRTYRPPRPLQSGVFRLWRRRIDQLLQAGRGSELKHLVNQFYVSIGQKRAVDIEIHDRLSQAFVDQQEWSYAIDEVDFALSLLPDDTTLLHRKGLILLSQGNFGDVEGHLAAVFLRLPKLREWPEMAGLEGRLYRDLYILDSQKKEYGVKSIEAYQRAFKADPTQLYPGGQAISVALICKDQVTVDALLPQVEALAQAESARDNSSYWSDFTLGELLVIKGDLAAAQAVYQRGLKRPKPPTRRDRDSALQGLQRSGKNANRDITAIQQILEQ